MSGPDFNPNYCLDYRPPRLQPVIRLLALPAYTRSRVYVTVGCLSVCLSVCLSHHSTAAAACGGFAAERRAGAGRPAATAPQHGDLARRSAANAMLTAELTKLNTDLFTSFSNLYWLICLLFCTAYW